jgi:hypothetical protein
MNPYLSERLASEYINDRHARAAAGREAHAAYRARNCRGDHPVRSRAGRVVRRLVGRTI